VTVEERFEGEGDDGNPVREGGSKLEPRSQERKNNGGRKGVEVVEDWSRRNGKAKDSSHLDQAHTIKQ
jgi:hypothetical protein